MAHKYISFVNTDKTLRKVRDKVELHTIVQQCRRQKIPLCDLDLSDQELSNMDFGELEINNVIFNTYDVSQPNHKTIFNVNFKGSSIRNVSFTQCLFVRCNFDSKIHSQKETGKLSPAKAETASQFRETRLSYTDFSMCEFISCRFRRTLMDIADFRYSQFTNCSLGGCRITLGDFYMAAFKGTTNFSDSKFIRCSITNATFEHHCLRIDAIEKLAQECYRDYTGILIGCKNWHKQNPCADFNFANHYEDQGEKTKSKSYVRNEAAMVYAQLSGFYAGKGLFRDSNKAYERAKQNEARSQCLFIADEFRDAAKRMLKKLSKKKEKGTEKETEGRFQYKRIIANMVNLTGFGLSCLLGHGFKLRFVISWFVLLVLGYTLLFHHKNKEKPLDWYDELAYSLNNAIGPFEQFYNVVGGFAASLQTTVGILLIGFAGFVLANKIRNNS